MPPVAKPLLSRPQSQGPGPLSRLIPKITRWICKPFWMCRDLKSFVLTSVKSLKHGNISRTQYVSQQVGGRASKLECWDGAHICMSLHAVATICKCCIRPFFEGRSIHPPELVRLLFVKVVVLLVESCKSPFFSGKRSERNKKNTPLHSWKWPKHEALRCGCLVLPGFTQQKL